MHSHIVVIINRLQGHRGAIDLYPTLIPKAHYQDMTGVKLGNTDNITNTSGYLQIPSEVEGYLPPHEWKLSDKVGKWTIQEHDMVLKGSYDLAFITKDTINDIQGVRTIESFELVDYGITIPKHWGVYLK